MKYAAALLTLTLASLVCAKAEGARYIHGNTHRIGVRNSAMGGNHIALEGDLSAALVNPAALLQEVNATLFGAEGFIAEGPDFDTRGGANLLETRQDSPPLLLGFSTTYRDDYAFALVDGLRYDSRFSGRLNSVDTSSVTIPDYHEEVRLNTTGLAIATRVRPRWVLGLGIYLDRQKVFKEVDYTPVSPEFVFEDYEAFGTATALHGAIGVLWSPRGRTSYAVAFQTEVDLANNLTLHTFQTQDDENMFFRESHPESFDAFPFTVGLGAHHRLKPDTDIYADLALVNWGTDPNRNLTANLSLGAEKRLNPKWAVRAGLYNQTDPGDYTLADGRTAEDMRLLDLRNPTTSSYSEKNSELFLTGGVGLKAGYFIIDASLEDSHLISDFGRTIFKLGLTAVLTDTLDQ